MRVKKTGIILRISMMLTLFIVIASNGIAQQKLDSLKNYTFEYLGGRDKHVVTRQFLTDSTFIQNGTITYENGSYSTVDTLMVGENEWFYKNKGEWLPYFSIFDFHKGERTYLFGEEKMFIDGKEKMLPSVIAIPLRTEIINGRQVYVYRMREKNDISAYLTEYYFDFELGVVKIIDTGYPPQYRVVISSLL